METAVWIVWLWVTIFLATMLASAWGQVRSLRHRNLELSSKLGAMSRYHDTLVSHNGELLSQVALMGKTLEDHGIHTWVPERGVQWSK